MIYVLVETSNDALFEIAEKIKLKMPIEENDLYKEDDPHSILGNFKCFMPGEEDIKFKSSYRTHFTAAYQENLRGR